MPRPLSQRGLQAFRLTVLTGSVSAAATAVARSQPAVSRLLKELEDEIGIRLFDRVKGRLLPTSDGLLLFDEVQRSFVGLERIASAVGEIREGRRGALSIAALPAVAISVLPQVIARFTGERPDTMIQFQAVPSPIAAQLVLTRECQLGFVSTAVDGQELRFERRYRAGGMCIMPANHRLAARSIVEVADLDGEPFISLSASTRLGAQLALVLDNTGTRRQTRVETHLCPLASALVLEGAGIAIVDSITAMSHVQAGGVARLFRAPVGMEFGIVCLDGSECNATQAMFIAACDSALTRLPGMTMLPSDRRLESMTLATRLQSR